MAVSRQRMFQQKGQVDTQYEIIGGRDFESKPSDEVVNEFDTADSLIVDAASQGPGQAWNTGQKQADGTAEGGQPVFKQIDDVETQESYVLGPRYDSEVSESYKDFNNLV